MQIVVDGLAIGALYALVALALVVVYETTRVVNFAQVAVGTIAGFSAWHLRDVVGLPLWLAVLAALAAGVVLGMMAGTYVTYAMRRATHLERTVATLGLTLVLGLVSRELFGEMPRILAVLSGSIEIFGTLVSRRGLAVIAVAGVVALAVFWSLRRTDLGVKMRAISQDPTMARQYGVKITRVEMASWALGSMIGAIAGVLAASYIQVDHQIGTTLVVQSLAAMVLGGFGTARGAVLGGAVLGIATSIIVGVLAPGFGSTFVLLVILSVLAVRPQGLLGSHATLPTEMDGTGELPPLPGLRIASHQRKAIVVTGGLTALAVMAAAPFVPLPFHLVTLTVFLSTAVSVMALSFLMGYGGVLSLGQGGLATVGAYAAVLVAGHFEHLHYVVVLAVGALAGGIMGLLLGWVTLRLSGLYLALATLAFLFAVPELIQAFSDVTGGPLGINVPQAAFPAWIDSRVGQYYLVLGSVVMVGIGFHGLLRSRFGRRLVAVRDAPSAAAANGVRTRLVRIIAFGIASAVTGLGGALLASTVTYVSPFDYGIWWSILLILAVVIAGQGAILRSLVGSFVIVLVPVMFSRTPGLSEALLGAILILLLSLRTVQWRLPYRLLTKLRPVAEDLGEVAH